MLFGLGKKIISRNIQESQLNGKRGYMHEILYCQKAVIPGN